VLVGEVPAFDTCFEGQLGDAGVGGWAADPLACGEGAFLLGDALDAEQPVLEGVPPDFGTEDLELVLVAPGPTPIELIKRIRQITGFGLMDSRALLETCPSVVVTGLSEAAGSRPA
jgi:hypothetical protein